MKISNMRKAGFKLKIKCLQVPYYYRSEKLRQLNEVREWPDCLPSLDHDGWYKTIEGDWIEFEGKQYIPIGDFDETLKDLTIAERPLRDCEYKAISELKWLNIFPKLEKLRQREEERRRQRSAYLAVRKRTRQIRKEQRSGTDEGLDRAVVEWFERLGKNL